MKILVVEDERDLNNIICKILKKNSYSVDACYNGQEAIDYIKISEYDLIILDIMMPVMDGYSFLEFIRNEKNTTPVLILTAKDSIDDRVKGLDKGGDDYLIKPFDFEELLARVRAFIRRRYGNVSNEIKVDDLIIDCSKKSVTRAGKIIDLTGKEYEVLEYLMQNKEKILTRDQILEHVWDFEYDGASNIIDVLIKNIRKKIDIGDSKPIIHTKRGVGYTVHE